MRRDPNSLLRRLVLVLGAVLLIALAYSAYRYSQIAPPAPVLLEQDALEGEHVRLPVLANHTQPDMTQRPLFWSSRRVLVVSEDASEPEAPGEDAIGKVKLLGVFHAGTRSGAILSDDGKPGQRLRIGASIHGWKLEQANDATAVFVKNGKTRELHIKPTTAQEQPKQGNKPSGTTPQGKSGSSNAPNLPAVRGKSSSKRIADTINAKSGS